MRHRVAHRKLGRVTEHRIAMLRNQAITLLGNERIETTVARGKELRPFVERLITVAKRSLKANADKSSIESVNARRMVARDIADKDVVAKLFESIAPRYAERPGGYTRMLRLGRRRGDDAEIAQIELIGSEFDPVAEAKKKETAGGDGEAPKRSMRERLRSSLGGGKKAERADKPKVQKAAKGARKVSTPRKAGGGS